MSALISTRSMTSLAPWVDRSGRVSGARLIALALVLAPAIWMACEWWFGLLSKRPVTDILRECGDWSIRLVFLALAISPLRMLTRSNRLLAGRRIIGVGAALYFIAHLLFYALDQKFAWWTVAREIVLRFYLTIGFVAALGLIAMALTSSDAAARRLGALRWARLHSVVYGVATLALVHYFLQVRLKAYEPAVLAGVAALLGAYRLMRRWRGDASVLATVALAVFAGLFSAVAEAVYYHIANHAPVLAVLAGNLDFEDEVSPAWWAFAIGLLFVVARLSRRWFVGAPAR